MIEFFSVQMVSEAENILIHYLGEKKLNAFIEKFSHRL